MEVSDRLVLQLCLLLNLGKLCIGQPDPEAVILLLILGKCRPSDLHRFTSQFSGLLAPESDADDTIGPQTSAIL